MKIEGFAAGSRVAVGGEAGAGVREGKREGSVNERDGEGRARTIHVHP